MNILTVGLLIILIGCLFLSVRRTLIVVILLALSNYLQLADINLLFLVPVAPGVSLNFRDILRLVAIGYIVFTPAQYSTSIHLKKLTIYLFLCVGTAALLSVVFLNANVAAYGFGDRLRNYADYLFIFGLAALIRSEEDFWFFIKAVFAIALVASGKHILEFFTGRIITFGEVTGLRVGEYGYGGYKRIFNKAPMLTLFVCSLSFCYYLLQKHKKIIITATLVLSSISIALTFTRTMYVFIILAVATLFFQITKRMNVNLVNYTPKIVAGGVLILVFTVMIGGGGLVKTILYRFNTIDNAVLTNTDTISARTMQFQNTKSKVLSSPLTPLFGLGFSSQSAQLYTHDLGFTNIISNLGLLGLIFIILWFRYIYKMPRYLFKEVEDERYRQILLVIIAFFFPLLITAYSFDYFTSSGFMMTVLLFTSLEIIYRFKRNGIIA